MAEKDPYDLVQDAEEHLEEFIQWQIDHGATNDFRGFAEYTGKVKDIFKYAIILYPRFILIEGAIVLSDHYNKANWEIGRKQSEPLAVARAINHVHIEDYLRTDLEAIATLEKELGHLLAFFWQMAARHQFPNVDVRVQFDGNVIDIFQDSST